MKRHMGIKYKLLAGGIILGLSISFLPEIARAANSLSNVSKGDARYAGTYVYGENPEHGRAIVREAISKAINQLPVAFRRLASRRLAEVDPLIHRIVIEPHDGLISVRVVGERSAFFSTHPGLTEKVTDLKGKQVDLTQRFTDQGLEQLFVDPRGSSRVLYTLRANGQQLLVSTVTTSPLLNTPISYQLLYVRQ
jgi:hypothetical protein